MNTKLKLTAVALLCALATACGGGGGDDDNNGNPGGGDPTPVNPTPVNPTPVDPTPVDPTPVDPVDPEPQEIGLSGTWRIDEDISGNCGDDDESISYTITISQNGSDLSVSTPSGTFGGEINGTSVAWTGSYAEDGGTSTTSITATVNQAGTTLSGSSVWSWSGLGESCNGTTRFSGTKQ